MQIRLGQHDGVEGAQTDSVLGSVEVSCVAWATWFTPLSLFLPVPDTDNHH